MKSEIRYEKLSGISQSENETLDASLPSSKAPKDNHHIAYILMYIIGAGVLWCYNVLVTITLYFTTLFPSSNMGSLIPVILQWPSVVLMFLLIRFGSLVSFSIRITTCFIVFAVCMISLPLVNQYDASIGINITFIAVIGISSAIVQNSVFGFASIFPPMYMQAVMGGQGLAGLLANIVSAACKAAFPKDEGMQATGTIVLYLAGGFCALCAVAYMFLNRLPFTQYYLNLSERSDKEAVPIPVMADDASDVEQPLLQSNNSNALKISYVTILKKLINPIISIFSVFVLTFLCFPGITVNLQSKHDYGMGWNSWYTLILLTIFNLFDTIGRSLPSVYVAFSKNYLWIPALCRFALYPFFVLASKDIYIFGNDYFVYVLMAIFAFSNGYISTLIMMFAGDFVEQHEKSVAGYMMPFFLTLGILVGSQIAYALANANLIV